MQVSPVPEGMNCLIPHLTVRGAHRALEFYKEAFRAQERQRLETRDGRILQSVLDVCGQVLFVSDEFRGGPRAPGKGHESPLTLHLYVGDTEFVFDRALRLGGREVQPVCLTYRGEKHARFQDPFGHHWSISTRVEWLSTEEMSERAQLQKGGGGELDPFGEQLWLEGFSPVARRASR